MGFNGIGHFADLFGPSTTTAVEQLFQQQPFQLHHQQQQPRYEECCVPTGDCVVRSAPIRPDDPRAPDLYARVTCSDRGCPAGRYMHRECFDAWERLVLAYMKNAAAAAYSASTTVKDPWAAATNNNAAAAAMNHQTAAYEMAYKACGCRCGRGYLKKDPEWPPAAGRRRSDDADSGVGSGRATVAASGGKKKKRRPAGKPMPPPPPPQLAAAAVDCAELRLRAGSLSGGSSNGSSSPVTNSTAGSSVSPAHSGGSFGSGSSVAAGSSKRRMAAACPKDVFER